MRAIPSHSTVEARRSSRVQGWLLLTAVSQVLMEVTLASLWYQGILPEIPLSWPVIFAVIGIVYFSSYWLRYLISFTRLESFRQLIFLAWLLFVLAASLLAVIDAGLDINLLELLRQPELLITRNGAEGILPLHLLAITLVVSRGSLLPRTRPSIRNIQLGFQLGLILLFIYGISFAPAHPTEAASGLYLYLFFALFSMSTSRIVSLSEEHATPTARFGAGWLLSVLLATMGFLGLAMAGGWLFSQQIVAWIVRGFALLLSILSAILLMALNPLFAFLAQFVSRVIEFIRKLTDQFGSIRLPKLLENLTVHASEMLEKVLPGNVGSRLVVLMVALIFITATVLLTMKFRAYQHRVDEEDSGNIDTAKIPAAFLKIIRRLIPANFQKRLPSPGQALAAARIRFLYRKMIMRARKLGLERPPSATPLEFIPALDAVFPNCRYQIEIITFAYVRVRYGEFAETLREVETVQRAWDAIRRSNTILPSL